MITDNQVKELITMINNGKSAKIAAMKTDMCLNSAKKYIEQGKMPSQLKPAHNWKTRDNPFEEHWEFVAELLEINPGLQGKTVFKELQRKYPRKYQDGQIRTLQRRIKQWRATEGPPKDITFPQEHYPGDLSCSDFTHMNELAITISMQPFNHMVYHFVLTYSNWEHATICFSESFEALIGGFQNAVWTLGGVPQRHRTDNLSAAVNNLRKDKAFTGQYTTLLDHYKIKGFKINAGNANENGDVEVSHYHFKTAVDQALMLRGSRDFENREKYRKFLDKVFQELNKGRQVKLEEELKVLRSLPDYRLNDHKVFTPRVTSNSTIHIQNNTYSVDSRLKRERIKVKLFMDHLEIWYGQKRIDTLPRLRGENKSRIEYRHIIDSLVKKPGAFANYRHRKDMFPSSHFRIAFDYLREKHPGRANREYLQILYFAAKISEELVERSIIELMGKGVTPLSSNIEICLNKYNGIEQRKDPEIDDINLHLFDELITGEDAA